MEYQSPPRKRRLERISGASTSVCKYYPVPKKDDPYDDEYIRQYILYYYQFHKSEGFVIDWDKLDYNFSTTPITEAYPLSQYRTNAQVIRDAACRAINQYNADKGTSLVFLDHVSASQSLSGVMPYWITFWATDLASSSLDPKLYQTNVICLGPTYCEVLLFRLKPTDEEIAVVQVDPPPPLYDDDSELPTILFTVKGPGSGYMSIPEVTFTRIPAEEPVSSPKFS